MAFLTKVGNMFRQTANRQITSEISVSGPSIYQALRYMSSSKLFVGGISFQTDDNGLKEAFDKYGNVVEVCTSVFISLDLHGRRVRVNYATERPQRTFNNNYGNYGGGGYGSGGGGYGSGGGGYGGGGYGSGGGGYGGGGGYNAGGGGYGGGTNVNYGDDKTNYAGQNTYDGGAGNHGGGGGSGSSDVYTNTSVDGGNAGLGYGDVNHFGANESSGDGSNLDDSLDTNSKEDDDAGDFAKRA
ncbi:HETEROGENEOUS NUCLEAR RIBONUCLEOPROTEIN 87F-RELATED [Salix viminalis]|uniref:HETEROGENEOUS NUCLEAR RIBONUCLEOPROTEIN 87F-RELATED n=1 Tax=Salix viminalis TaxID=40686 RepID=A0A9Q0NVU7_SALVM|nr:HETEROGENEOUS NUCLEAR RIBONUCLEOPROTEIN 87F-RELATED [Salix viminalis]